MSNRRRALLSSGNNLLPSMYQQVEYLEGTGTQYIDTGAYLNDKSTFELEYQFTQVPQYSRGIYGAYINGASRFEGLTRSSSSYGSAGNLEYGYYTNYMYDISTDLNKHVLKQDQNIFYFDGVRKYSFSRSSFTQNRTAYIFHLHINSTSYQPMIGRVYRANIQSNGILVRDFVPCYRKSDHEPGLYDIINNIFYTNAGTGTFLVGSDVK